MMPVMDGPALIGALGAEPEFATVPVPSEFSGGDTAAPPAGGGVS
jgi:hypothetical protein